MSDRVIRQDREGLCTLTLNRPEKLNALDTLAFQELDAHLAALEGEMDRIGCVLIRGAGRGFCAGADLDAIGKAPVPPSFKPGVIERLQLLPQPVIAAIHGVCYTGGLELALACDFILADATARFADTHGVWGLVGGWGMTQRLPRRVGIQAAKRMMMTARPLDADEAKAHRSRRPAGARRRARRTDHGFRRRRDREQLAHQFRDQEADARNRRHVADRGPGA